MDDLDKLHKAHEHLRAIYKGLQTHIHRPAYRAGVAEVAIHKDRLKEMAISIDKANTLIRGVFQKEFPLLDASSRASTKSTKEKAATPAKE